MSAENVEAVRSAYERFAATGEFVREVVTNDFVWDMSHFEGWPEQQVYEGADGAQAFVETWAEAWDDWELKVDELLDAGDKVVALASQRARSKVAGMPVEMFFAQVWTMRDG